MELFSPLNSISAYLSASSPVALVYAVGLLLVVFHKPLASARGFDISRLLTLMTLALAGYLELNSALGVETSEAMMHDPYSRFFRVITLIGFGLFTVFFDKQTLTAERRQETGASAGWIFPTMLLTVGGTLNMASAYDLVSLFLSFELTFLPIYLALAYEARCLSNSGLQSSEQRAHRALFYGLFGSVTLAFGLVILYGLGGATNLIQLRINLSVVFLTFKKIGPAVILATALVATGLASRMGIAPFHLWYDTLKRSQLRGLLYVALMAGVLTGALGVSRLFDNALIAFSGEVMSPLDWAPLLVALVTITCGLSVVAALREQSLERIVFWLCLGQAALVLAGIATHNELGLMATLVHLLSYTIALPLVGYLTLSCRGATQETQLSDIKGLARRSPLMGGVLALALASLGALPWTGGFSARISLIEGVMEVEQWWLLTVLVLASLGLLVIVMRVLVALYSPANEEGISQQFTLSQRVSGALAAAMLVYLGVAPSTIEEIAREAVRVFAL